METTTKPKIFIFSGGGQPGWMMAYALAEDGAGLASHLCSHEGFMHHDMGITSSWKHDTYNEHYPNGWELEWVPTDQLDTHEGFQKAFALNKERAAEKEKNEAA